jgi:23S rRNA G2069 N7-methylase RlmK/C1962 C5-methylase RlmI
MKRNGDRSLTGADALKLLKEEIHKGSFDVAIIDPLILVYKVEDENNNARGGSA